MIPPPPMPRFVRPASDLARLRFERVPLKPPLSRRSLVIHREKGGGWGPDQRDVIRDGVRRRRRRGRPETMRTRDDARRVYNNDDVAPVLAYRENNVVYATPNAVILRQRGGLSFEHPVKLARSLARALRALLFPTGGPVMALRSHHIRALWKWPLASRMRRSRKIRPNAPRRYRRDARASASNDAPPSSALISFVIPSRVNRKSPYIAVSRLRSKRIYVFPRVVRESVVKKCSSSQDGVQVDRAESIYKVRRDTGEIRRANVRGHPRGKPSG